MFSFVVIFSISNGFLSSSASVSYNDSLHLLYQFVCLTRGIVATRAENIPLALVSSELNETWSLVVLVTCQTCLLLVSLNYSNMITEELTQH